MTENINSQTPTPPPSPRTLSSLLDTHVQSLQNQAQSLRQLGVSLLQNGADPSRADVVELDAIYRRTTAALEDALRAQQLQKAQTPPRAAQSPHNMSPPRHALRSPPPERLPQHTIPILADRKRNTPDPASTNAGPWSSEPRSKRLRSSHTQTRKDFANPYESSGTPPELDIDDISAEVNARMRAAEDRRRRRLKDEEAATPFDGKNVERRAGHKHRRSSGSTHSLAQGQDGGRYWLDDPGPASASQQQQQAQEPARIPPTLRTSTPTEPAQKKRKTAAPATTPATDRVSNAKAKSASLPLRKTPPSAIKRALRANYARGQVNDINAQIGIHEVESRNPYVGPGTKRYAMKRAAEKAQNESKLQGKYWNLLGKIETERAAGMETGKRKAGGEGAGGFEGDDVGEIFEVRGKRRRVQGWA
ncbi:MAG: hypothetical protein Q9162_004152 [Coniocarpon cinnabarinum]